MFLLSWFTTGPDIPVLEDEARIRRMYERKRRNVFWTLMIGYSFFYVCRAALSVMKKPMIDAGVANAEELGRIGSAMLLTYAFGKFINGVLADRSNVARFMSTGLLASAAVVICFGFVKSVPLLIVLWALHGWFQSMGAGPSAVAISNWFSNRERGTRYGIWSTAHSVGEGLTYAITAAVVAYYGYQFGFWAAGTAAAIVSLFMYLLLSDRPQTYGLPPIADYKNDHTQETKEPPISVRDAQLEVLRNPYIWVLGLSCMFMYVARYGINSWGVLYLQEIKGYTLISAGFLLSCAKIVESIGTVCCGIISDFFFGARRNVTTLIYGVLQVSGLIILLLSPTTHLANLEPALVSQFRQGPLAADVREALNAQGIAVADNLMLGDVVKDKWADTEALVWTLAPEGWHLPWTGLRFESVADHLNVYERYSKWHFIGLSMFGFGLGGLLAFLGGLIAIDISSKRAAGAAMGTMGLFGYIGASIQDWTSGSLIEAGRLTVNGVEVHDFSRAYMFWLAAAILSVLLYLTLWRVKARD